MSARLKPETPQFEISAQTRDPGHIAAWGRPSRPRTALSGGDATDEPSGLLLFFSGCLNYCTIETMFCSWYKQNNELVFIASHVPRITEWISSGVDFPRVREPTFVVGN